MSKQPIERTLDAQLLGRRVTFDYSETWIAWSVLGLRVILAYVFLQAGLSKLAEEGWTNPGGWSSESFLVFAVDDANPFKGFFDFLAEFTFLWDPLVMYGQILIGLALLLGIAFRFTALLGGMQMILFWLASFEGGFAAGLPIEHGYIVDYTLVYAILLFALGAIGAGRILGVDARIEAHPIVERNPWLKYLLG